MGYAFSGWLYTNGVEDVVFADREVVSNLTVEADAIVDLSAVWFANSYSVKFNANGGSGAMADEPMTYDAEKALTACAFTKTGYTFAGWAREAATGMSPPQLSDVFNLHLRRNAMHHRDISEVSIKRKAKLLTLSPSHPLTLQHRVIAVDTREGTDIRLVGDKEQVELAALRDSFEFFDSHLIVRSVTPRGSMM